jgi:hypothetical protein
MACPGTVGALPRRFSARHFVHAIAPRPVTTRFCLPVADRDLDRGPPTRIRAEAPSRPPKRPAVIHSSLYLPSPVYEVLRKIAFDERAKIHDLVMQGIEAVLRKRGYPSVDSLKSGTK